MSKNYKKKLVFNSESRFILNLAKSIKVAALAICAMFISRLSYGQCMTGGNGTETVAYASSLVSNSAGAVDADFTSTSAQLSIFLSGTTTMAINFSKPVNPGDSIYFIIGQGASLLNLTLFGSITGTAYSGLATSSDPSVGTPIGSNSASNFLSALIIGGVTYQALAIGVSPTATTGASSIALVYSALVSVSTLNVYGVYVRPGPPTAINQTFCYPGSSTPVTLQATKYTLPSSTIDVKWYKANDTLPADLVQTDLAQAGQPYTTSYTTPAPISATTSYYVRQSTSGCGLYSPLTMVTATVLPTATPALVTNTTLTLDSCGSDGSGYISFVDAANPTNKYLSINPNGNTGFSFTSATAVESSSNIVAFNSASSVAIGQRLYTVTDAGTGGYYTNGGMKVRIYYLTTDTTTARSSVHSVSGTTLSNLWFKVPGDVSGLSSLVTPTGITNSLGLNSRATYGTEGAQKYVEFSGINGFSTFGFAAAKGTSTILPISGLTLTGKLISGIPQLTWTTFSETNSNYFSVQSSIDGSNFTDIGQVTASGTSSSLKTYSYSDKLATGSVVYYRIKAVDKDGETSYSSIIAVSLSGIGTALKIYPNPVTNLVNIETGTPGTYVTELFTIDGKKVTSTQLSTASGLITYNIDRTNVPSGIYLLKTTSKSASTSTYNTIMLK